MRVTSGASLASWRGLLCWPVLLAACGEAPPPPPPAPPPFLAQPSDFLRDVPKSEAVAIDGLHLGLGKKTCAALLGRDAVALRGRLSDTFRGRAPAATGVRRPVKAMLEVQDFALAQPLLGREAFADALVARLSAFAAAERCKLKPVGIKVHPRLEWAWVKLSYTLAGRSEDAGLIERGTWTAVVERFGSGWRFRELEVGPIERIEAQAIFADVSKMVGIGVPHTPISKTNQGHLTDYGSRDNLGGLAVVDWDGDGFDDLLAWHRRRFFGLFHNDGAGGFELRHLLLEPEQIGYFMLLVDLDGDGQQELLSTEVSECRDGLATLPLFKRVGEGFEALPGLTFPRDCRPFQTANLEETDPVVFQHIAAEDIDGDGDLDLYVSGYLNRDGRRGDFNLFDAQDGERDLLFVNQGGLKFSEEGTQRGLDATRWTYVATFFDHDEDGDPDLYVANDYGPNGLYLNEGGHFALQPQGPMTPHSQSMGLTVADFDGDLDFDLYVSNMYSSAGKRQVPLAEGTLPKETYDALLGSAAGNWMFLREGKGRFTESAAKMGVQKAGWAWGQAAADFDNDGDRDLYVVNGMTSHSQLPEKDF